MDIQYYGGNCIKISTKKASLVIDDNLAELGQKSIIKDGDIALFSGPHKDVAKEVKLLIDQPGEYEASDISLQGIAARSHTDESDKKTATVLKVIAEDIRLVAVGHIYPELNDEQLEAIGTVDILIIPVGGNGFTLDPDGALKVIKKIEPKIIIPTNYADKQLKYEVPALPLDEALKGLTMEPNETVPKLKLKASDLASDLMQLIVLERQ